MSAEDRSVAATEAVMSSEEAAAQARDLWQKCQMLTHELLKFINKEDIDEFIELSSQQEKIVDKIKALPPNNFRHSPEGEAIVADMKPLYMQIIYKARAWLNKNRRNNATVRSYDLTGNKFFSPLGHLLNKEL